MKKISVLDLKQNKVGEIELAENVFSLKPRQDIIKLMIEWQLAKARKGTHETKTVSDVSGTTKKPFRQKGTGNARQGSLRSVQMRGGGVSHGPHFRSHAIKLTKKFRKLALCHALSEKMLTGKLIVLDKIEVDTHKTKFLVKDLYNFSQKSLCVISDDYFDENFFLAARNIPNVTLLPQLGANVYDIIKHDCLVISKEAISSLESRLK